jgi:hypothetical protein
MESARMASEKTQNPPQMTTSTGDLEVFPHPARSCSCCAGDRPHYEGLEVIAAESFELIRCAASAAYKRVRFTARCTGKRASNVIVAKSAHLTQTINGH